MAVCFCCQSRTLLFHYYRVKLFKDEKIANAATFVFMREDHTLGNIMRMQLLEDKEVLFAGYKMPHPLVNDMSLRVQTSQRKDPVAAVGEALSRLNSLAHSMRDEFNVSGRYLFVVFLCFCLL